MDSVIWNLDLVDEINSGGRGDSPISSMQQERIAFLSHRKCASNSVSPTPSYGIREVWVCRNTLLVHLSSSSRISLNQKTTSLQNNPAKIFLDSSLNCQSHCWGTYFGFKINFQLTLQYLFSNYLHSYKNHNNWKSD